MLADWIIAIEGTEDGRQAAMILALISAVAHACLGALQKGRFDPWVARGAIDLCAAGIAVPLALFVVPPPTVTLLWVLAGAMVIHLAYKWFLAMAYERGAFTAVYPIVRGVGPIATIGFAGLVFGEFFSLGQWLGVALLSGGIFALAGYNLMREQIDRRALSVALVMAAITGVMVAVYTVYDAWGIRLAEDPFTFVVWFFLTDGLLFPLLLGRRWRRAAADGILTVLFTRGFIGACIAFCSFGAVFLATRLDKVGEAAALRETSVIFAAIIGWAFLGEQIGRFRAAAMIVIATGAVLIEIAA